MKTKLGIKICVLTILVSAEALENKCNPLENVTNDYSKPVCYVDSCIKKIKSQVAEELNAAFHYLYMAAFFDQDSVNRPGLAKFLYESASEEREHAMLMLDYLSLRGITFDEQYRLLQNDILVPKSLTYKNTMETALNMEIKVTNLIFNIVEECADDFHGADTFTNPILAEQHTGVRKLQGLLKTYDDMILGTDDANGIALAEYLFDKKISD